MSTFPIPTIQISQQYAKIGIEAPLGEYEMRQQKADFSLEREQGKFSIESRMGDLEIDQTKAWDALGRGPHLETMHKIYSQAPQVYLQGLAKIVEKGNRLGDLRIRSNVIAEMARESLPLQFPEFDYAGEASNDNVDIHYRENRPQIEYIPTKLTINFQPNKPEITYTPGKFKVYMTQYPKVEITPPQVDLKL